MHTEFFNKSTLLFPRDDHLQHKHSAISNAAHGRLLKDLVRRIYKTTSSFSKFIDTIRETTNFYQHKSLHTQGKVTMVAKSILSSTKRNRYDLTQLQTPDRHAHSLIAPCDTQMHSNTTHLQLHKIKKHTLYPTGSCNATHSPSDDNE
jgi:hypothetical protein